MKINENKLIELEESDISPEGEVVIPNGVNDIKYGIFQKFDKIKRVILPDSIDKIESSTFKDCYNLEYVKLPKNLEVIPEFLFQNCKSLKEVKMPENYKEILQRSFEGCTSLADFEFPKTLTLIKENAFAKCYSLKNVTIPESVTRAEPCIFEECLGLETAKILNKDLSYAGFRNCTSLKSVYFDKDLYLLPTSYFQGCSSLTDVVFNKKCSSLSQKTFASCTSLEEIKLPAGLTEINIDTFAGCENLKTVTFPKTVKTIARDAFRDCDSLENFTVPATVERFFPSSSDSMVFFNKTDDWFYLSREQTQNSIPIEYLNIDYIFLTKYWDYKDIILRDQRKPASANFYSRFAYTLPREQVIDIIQNHNFTFLNQIPNLDSKYYGTDTPFKFLYNLGAVSKPVQINGKNVDYAQKVVNFLLPKIQNNHFYFSDISVYTMHFESQGLKPGYTDFFLQNYDEILEECNNDSKFLGKSYNSFYDVERASTSNRGSQRQLKPTIAKFKTFFLDSKFKGVNDENRPIARKITPYFDSQVTFDRAVEIDNKRKGQNISDNILRRPLSEKDVFASIDDYASKIPTAQAKILGDLGHIADNEFTFEWLQKNDPDNFILGKYCSCCAHLEGAGYGIMHASIVHPHVQNLVIKDKNGDIVAKSTLYINPKRRYGVCNNVEINTLVKKEFHEQIYQKYILGIQEFARAYNKEHPFLPLKQINVGMGHNDLTDNIKEHRSRAILPFNAIDYGKYGVDGKTYNGDSFMNQYVIWSAKEDAKMLAALKKETKNKDTQTSLDEQESEENQNSQPA